MEVHKNLYIHTLLRDGMLSLLLEYKLQLKIVEKLRLSDGLYYICPRCRVSLDRDYQNFCDRCGQHLDWTGCRKARVIFPGNKR